MTLRRHDYLHSCTLIIVLSAKLDYVFLFLCFCKVNIKTWVDLSRRKFPSPKVSQYQINSILKVTLPSFS